MLWKNNLRPFICFDKDPDSGGGGAGGNGDQGKDDPVRSFKQSELDAMQAERAKHARSAAVSDLLKDLGVTDAETLKISLKKLADLEASSKTDQEKLAEENKKLKEAAEASKKEAEDKVKAANERLMKAEVMTEAGNQKVRAEALADVWLFVEKSKITEKDGSFVGVKEAVEAVVKAKPYLVDDGNQRRNNGTPDRSKQGGNSNNNQQPPEKPATKPITL